MVSQQESQFASEPMTDVEKASGMVMRVEGILSQREGINLDEVRPRVARALKVSARTILNIRNQRRKTVEWRFMEGLRALLIDVLQSEIVRLDHEIHLHRQTAGSHRDDDLAAAEAQVAAARKTLKAAAR